MGQKVNPIGLRLGINRTWDSRWYAEGGEYSKMLHEDIHIRKVLRERLAAASRQVPQPELHLRADQSARYRALAEVLADAASAGLTRIGFVSDPRDTNAR